MILFMKRSSQHSETHGVQQVEKISPLQRIKDGLHNETANFVIGAILFAIALFVLSSYISFFFNGGIDQSAIEATNQSDVSYSNHTGRLGALISDILVNRWLGLSTIVLPIYLAVAGVALTKVLRINMLKWTISTLFVLFWGSIATQWILSPLFKESFITPGGAHGEIVLSWLLHNIGTPGVVILLLLTLILFAVYITRRTIEWTRRIFSFNTHTSTSNNNGFEDEVLSQADASEIIEQDIDASNNLDMVIDNTSNTAEVSEDEYYNLDDEEEDGFDSEPKIPTPHTGADSNKSDIQEIPMDMHLGMQDERAKGNLQEPYDPRLDLSHYKFPSLSLLKHYHDNKPEINESEQIANKNRITQTLRNFGIEITSISATVGPTVTLYEITPAAGIKITKIKHLEDDIALSLAALGIRIIAPIPGKGTIGIEVPNANPIIVSMESIIGSRAFAESKMELPVAIGKTITNEVYMFDLAKMPHLLVAGATGQGKSVGLNAIITSLLYKKHPAELKLVMVDPKMVEFSIYAPIERHFLAKLPDEEEAIITDTNKVIKTLKSLCIEMDDRYRLLKEAGVRSVKEYNELFKSRRLLPTQGHRFMPYIVVIIDEYGDLIMTAGKEIEMPIARIAQKARAVGMHMIIATQRPTTSIVTGNIKANFPARMAFRVSSMIDSRTILEKPGAEQLIGRGDLLFRQGNEPTRVQCAFVDTPEVTGICDFIKNQQGYTDAYMLPECIDEEDGITAGADSIDASKLDSLFEEAARLIVLHQQGSTSLIQRKFSIGYNRAGRLMDQLEKAGIVGKVDGSKPRQVLCGDEIALESILQNYR